MILMYPSRSILLFITLCFAQLVQASNSTSTISGVILDADAKPMHSAALVLAKAYSDERGITQIIEADSKGRIKAQVPNGWYQLYASGSDHTELAVGPPMYLYGQNMELKAHLQAQDLSTAERIYVLCDFERYDRDKKHLMTKNPDGSWSVDIAVKSDSLAYQILPEGASLVGAGAQSGTEFDRLSYGLFGECRSVISVKNGNAHIVVHPTVVHATKTPATAEFVDAASKRQLAILQADSTMNQRFLSALQFDEPQLSQQWDVQKVREQAWTELSAERDPELKRLRMLCWLRINPVRYEGDSPNKQYIDQILNSIPATSLLWQWSPECVMWAVRKSSNPESEYGYKVKTEHSSDWVKQIVATDQGALTRKESALNSLLSNIQRQRVVRSQAQNQAALQADEIGAIRRGNQLPPFSFETLENDGSKISNDAMRGKWVLVDNWATWCGPCVREMPALHAAYEAYKSKNFTILSVSFDRQKEDIIKFRAAKYAMPWLQSFSPGVWQNEAAQIFEAHSIPKPILVDPNGVIRAIGVELRGVNLEQTLAKFIH